MSTIKPISDLRNYNTVLDCVKESEPVYLTKNGRDCFVILDNAEYEKIRRKEAEDKLFVELEKGRMSGEIEGWIDYKTARERLDAFVGKHQS